MAFTVAEMKRLHIMHGADLAMFSEKGNGPFSADPADYWQLADPTILDSTILPGYLALRIPEHYVRLTPNPEENHDPSPSSPQ
jgi:hypothetical protein